METLSKIQVALVQNGAVSGSFFEAGAIWSDQPTFIFVTRRPGCGNWFMKMLLWLILAI